MTDKNVSDLSKELEREGEILFYHDDVAVLVWETESSDLYKPNFTFNLYDKSIFLKEEEITEYYSEVYNGTSSCVIGVAIERAESKVRG